MVVGLVNHPPTYKCRQRGWHQRGGCARCV